VLLSVIECLLFVTTLFGFALDMHGGPVVKCGDDTEVISLRI